ncbi:MAG TPA: PEGA domain-containing protein [Myxococcota bacterium]|nr:PEGA domain-containing protein [Myxococcota bacterium]
MRRLTLASLILLLAVPTLDLPWSQTARAQLEEVAEDPVSESLAAARDKYAQGVKLAKRGQNEEAIAAFEAALPELGREGGSDIFYNLVNVARVSRDWRRVVLYSHGFLARESATRDAAEIEKMREFALARLEIRNPATSLSIEVPEGSTVYIDHTPIKGRSVTLARGRYTVTAELADHHPATTEITLGENPATLTLLPRAANYTGFLSVTTTPADGVTVFVDDKAVGRTPLKAALELPVGKRLIRFERVGFDAWTRYVEIARGKTETLEPRLEKTAPAPR